MGHECLGQKETSSENSDTCLVIGDYRCWFDCGKSFRAIAARLGGGRGKITSTEKLKVLLAKSFKGMSFWSLFFRERAALLLRNAMRS